MYKLTALFCKQEGSAVSVNMACSEEFIASIDHKTNSDWTSIWNVVNVFVLWAILCCCNLILHAEMWQRVQTVLCGGRNNQRCSMIRCHRAATKSEAKFTEIWQLLTNILMVSRSEICHRCPLFCIWLWSLSVTATASLTHDWWLFNPCKTAIFCTWMHSCIFIKYAFKV